MVGTMDSALVHARSLSEYLNKCNKRYIVHIALKEMGLGSDQEGFLYAKTVILLLCENPGLTLSNGAYAAAGILCTPKAGEKQVERAISRSVSNAWEYRDEQVWECYFPCGRNGKNVCPSNKAFLMAVVDFVELWQGFCEEVNYGKQYNN